MSTTIAPQKFTRRFDGVRARMLRVQIGRSLLRSVLLALVGLAAVTAADYLLELPHSVRLVATSAVGLLALAWAVWQIVSAVTKWNRPRTAVELEDCFPELGQSVRTTVQFGGLTDDVISSEGVRSTLVTALEEQMDIETAPLGLDAVVPVRRLQLIAGVAFAAVVIWGVACAINPEWNTATRRALLDERPYTVLAVDPGDSRIDEGRGVTIGMELAGRTNRSVVLLTRGGGDASAEWQEREIAEEDLASSETGKIRYEVDVPKLMEPLEYRVIAGKLESPTYRIDIRFPLKLVKASAEVTPPEYTGVAPNVIEDGNISVLEGTHALFRFELDRPPVKPTVRLSDLRESQKKDEDEPVVEDVAVTIEGSTIRFALDLTKDKKYSLTAEDSEGMPLPEKEYRIRVRKDQPPQVFFEEPREALEVHALAEILMRIRARDDFGVSRAGIVFQVNNEEEHTLLLNELEPLVAKDGRLTPQTQAALEKMLPLEHFELTQKDSVMYYAFAEDNYPAGARRTESDLRFIDIRPFRRTYRMQDPMDSMGNDRMGRELKSLDELIARQRFVLNRTLQMARRPESAGNAELNMVDRLIEQEGKLAQATRDLAEFLESRDVPGNDLLFKAEEAMLAVVDSLSAGKYDTAVLQEKDALRLLVEARDKVNFAISKKNRQTQAEIRQFDRTQTQKLRRPKNEEEEAQQVAERLRQLADEEEIVYDTLAGMMMDNQPPMKSKSSSNGSGKSDADPKEQKPSETKEGEAPKEGETPKENGGKKPQEGKSGEGESEKEAAKPGSEGKEGDSGKEGKEKEGESGKGKTGLTREEAQDKQADIVAEATDVEKVMQKLPGLTDLAKSRIAEALKNAQNVAGALDRGDTKQATKDARGTSQMFRELARQVEGLTATEAAKRIAMARDIARELSEGERDLEKELDPMSGAGQNKSDKPGDKPGKGQSKEKSKTGSGGGGESEEERNDELASEAGRLAETGRTLEDILKSIARSTDPADEKAAKQVQQVMQEGKVTDTVRQIERQPAALKEGKRNETKADARDAADRLEVASRLLEAVHRAIVTPRIAELIELEREAVELRDKLENLETDGQITDWHMDAEQLLKDLEKFSVSEEVQEDLREAMKAAGWGEGALNRRWGWGIEGSRYGAPVAYHRSSKRVVEELHNRIQELILGDLLSGNDEATPPQYEKLVERYIQVLSGAGGKSRKEK